MQVLCNFMKMLTCEFYEAFVHHGGTKRVPRRRNMPRQHIRKWCHGNISVPVAHRDTSAKGSERERVMQDGGVIPDSGFPRDGGMANEEHAQNKRAWCKHIVHLIHARASHHGHLGLYLWSVRFRGGSSSKQCRGSSCSRVIVGSSHSRFVVVHVGGSSCSGSWRVVV